MKNNTIKKNRQRENPTFANINLLGTCNANCYFCLGKDIKNQLEGKNQLRTHFLTWKNFEEFLLLCKQKNIDKLYLTGQTADGLQYEYLDQIVYYLQNRDFKVGVRTNGYLALDKIHSIKKMNGGIGYSIHSINKETNQKILGRKDIPDWETIIPNSGPNVRVSIVLNRYNVNEFDSLLRYISKFENVRYIQVRRISTDTRIKYLQKDIDLYEYVFDNYNEKYKPFGKFYLAEQYMIYGKEVNFWRTVETSCNSVNYFTDGTLSDEYFIVEGYLKYSKNI